MALLTRIEDIISRPMEIFHKQKGFHPVDLNRMALRCMEQGCRKGIRQTYAPNRFTLRLNAADLKDLTPFMDVIRSEVKGELRRVVEERNYLLAGELEVEIANDPKVPAGQPRVEGRMQGSLEPDSTFKFTEMAHESRISDKRLRDAETVLSTPEPESDSTVDAGFADGHARQKVVGEYGDHGEDLLGDRFRCQASLLAAVQMTRHMPNGSNGGRGLTEPKRIEWKGHLKPAAVPQPEPCEMLGRLIGAEKGLVLHITTCGIFLECCNSGGAGRASAWTQLEDGAEVRLCGSSIVYRSGPAPTEKEKRKENNCSQVINLSRCRHEKEL